ncbi:hypothetical protein L218DRAFT_963572 [Marasmius fiardii PR-910]|nr:hypothetical protein L218DRAFT_963572 [Marasmius fiardii PR-910]
MDRFLAPHTPEAVAHSYFNEHTHGINDIDEALLAGCASYRAFDRYLSGADLFILPRTRKELENVLRRYAYDAIHNTIARSRSTVEPGGYSRVCMQAEQSIRAVLDTGDNTPILLAMHPNPTPSRSSFSRNHSKSPPSIKTK